MKGERYLFQKKWGSEARGERGREQVEGKIGSVRKKKKTET